MKLAENVLSFIFERALHCECLSQVLEELGHQNISISRRELLQILRDFKHREKNISGSQFDLVQKKIKIEQELEQGLIKAKSQGLSWREAVYQLHISPGPDFIRLRTLYEKTAKK